MEWYQITNIDQVDSPTLVVYPDRVKKNIDILKKMLPDVKRLRPHVKTHKSADVTKILLASGFTQFKCATIAEAEMLGEAGAPDVLLAYQPVGPKANRLAELVKKFPNTKFSCLFDNKETLAHLNSVFGEINHRLDVYIDLNIGMNRTGIKPGNEADALYQCGDQYKFISVTGIHAYDGHLRDEDLAIRTKKCNDGFTPVLEMQSRMKQAGSSEPIIVVGGTTTFPIHAQRKNVVCSPGTFIYWDRGYHDTFAEQPFEYGALVITRVISKPEADLICIDLGHKSIASENSLDKRVFFLNVDNVQPVGHSEEHMVLKVTGANNFGVGDVLYGVPFHICPTVALYDGTAVINHHEATDQWTMLARNRKITL
jgi:D-serine deaminase-like pyridoxal phosphate-dependent protein